MDFHVGGSQVREFMTASFPGPRLRSGWLITFLPEAERTVEMETPRSFLSSWSLLPDTEFLHSALKLVRFLIMISDAIPRCLPGTEAACRGELLALPAYGGIARFTAWRY